MVSNLSKPGETEDTSDNKSEDSFSDDNLSRSLDISSLNAEILSPENGQTELTKQAGEGVGIGTLLTGAAIIALLTVSSSSNSPEAIPVQSWEDGGIQLRPAEEVPELPQWLLELDHVRQNTSIRSNKLTSEGWDRIRTEDDAVIFFGHVVKRKIAFGAAAFLGHGGLMYLALRKDAFQKEAFHWVGPSRDPVSKFDFTNHTALAANIEAELSQIPAWMKFVGKLNLAPHFEALSKLQAQHREKLDRLKDQIRSASYGVRWKSRKNPKPGEDYYEKIKRDTRSDMSHCEYVISETDKALEMLQQGMVTRARSLLEETAKYNWSIWSYFGPD